MPKRWAQALSNQPCISSPSTTSIAASPKEMMTDPVYSTLRAISLSPRTRCPAAARPAPAVWPHRPRSAGSAAHGRPLRWRTAAARPRTTCQPTAAVGVLHRAGAAAAHLHGGERPADDVLDQPGHALAEAGHEVLGALDQALGRLVEEDLLFATKEMTLQVVSPV